MRGAAARLYLTRVASMIFHILRRDEWERALRSGSYAPASLRDEGFIHCSTVEQAAATADLFFRGQSDLLILSIDEARLAAPLKCEAPAGDDARPAMLFPHIHGPLNLDAVVEVHDFPCRVDGSFELPVELGGRERSGG